MNRIELMSRLCELMSLAARQKAHEEARRAGWPLPIDVAVHLWLYVEGLLPESDADDGSS